MMNYTLISRDGVIETFEFEQPSLGNKKRGTFNVETKEVKLDSGFLGWPAMDGRLRQIMTDERNLEVGKKMIKAFG